ncbi:AraC family transcriptional regulator [Aquirhabdus sp.]|uniref:AraC family transcriptional regulator n=1 Tax=Aquirhabdus sp. TaxID=2824160 RepID=UPI00396C88F1
MSISTPLPTASPTVLGVYLGLLVDVVARWDISAEELLDGSGIKPEQLHDVFWYVDFKTFSELFKRAVILTNEPGLGFHIGKQMKVSCHGLIGFAAMIAKDVREALEIAQQFINLQSSAYSLRLEVEGDLAYYYVNEVYPDYSLGEVGTIAILLGFVMMGEAITGHHLEGSGDVMFKCPDYFDRFQQLLPGTIRFDQPYTRIVFPAAYLELPLIMADPLTARLAREQCKRELNALMKDTSFSRLVSELVYDEALGFCTIEEVADKLHLSTRTLQRQLAQENQSFSTLIDELRQRKATAMVKKREFSLELIAEKLGYTDTTNFIRAFKRWTGKTPKKYLD